MPPLAARREQSVADTCGVGNRLKRRSGCAEQRHDWRQLPVAPVGEDAPWLPFGMWADSTGGLPILPVRQLHTRAGVS